MTASLPRMASTTRKKPEPAAEKLAAEPAIPTPVEDTPAAVTEADVREESTEHQDDPAQTAPEPATEVKVEVGQKIQFVPEGRDDTATGTVAMVGAEGDVLAQWNGQEAWIAAKDITVLPS